MGSSLLLLLLLIRVGGDYARGRVLREGFLGLVGDVLRLPLDDEARARGLLVARRPRNQSLVRQSLQQWSLISKDCCSEGSREGGKQGRREAGRESETYLT